MGNSTNPDVVLILPFPEKKDDFGKAFEGPVATSIRAMLPDDDSWYLTYLVKCPKYENSISRESFAEPSDKQISQCSNYLGMELQSFESKPRVMGFGALVAKSLLKDKEFKITKDRGSTRPATAGGVKFDLTVNLDPRHAEKSPAMTSELKTYIDRVFRGGGEHLQVDGKNHNNLESNERFATLNPDDSMAYMDEALRLYKAGEISYVIFDLETSALTPWDGRIIMASFAHDADSRGIAIPLEVTNVVHHKDLSFKCPETPFNVSESERAKLLSKIGEVIETIPIVGHNLLFDIRWILYHNVAKASKIRILNDTFNSSVQFNSMGFGIDNSLKGLCRRYFDVKDDWELQVQEYLKKFKLIKERTYSNIPTSVLGEYAALDSYFNRLLFKHFEHVIPEGQKRMAAFVTEAIPMFADCETSGMYMDMEAWKFLETSYTEYLVRKRAELDALPIVDAYTAPYLAPLIEANLKKKKPVSMEQLRENAFNLNNAAKVSEIAYDKRFYALPAMEDFMTEKKMPSLNKDARGFFLSKVLVDTHLETLEEKDPVKAAKWREAKLFVKKVSEFKRISKLLKDYVYSMPNSAHNGLYKPEFRLNGTVTGRLASAFHSMPNRCDLKRLISSRWREDGGIIVAVDFSQLELRVVAAVAQEPSFIEPFKQGVDAHTATAAVIYKCKTEEVTSVQRSIGKRVNFAILYGKGEEGLADEIGCSKEEAGSIMRNFYSGAGHLAAWKKSVEKFTLKTGTVQTMFGRVIPVPQAFSKKEWEIAEAKRLAVNYPIQSAGSDIVFDMVKKVGKELVDRGMRTRFLATVHDSLELDVYPGEIFELVRILKFHGEDNIQTAHPWMICPTRIDFEIGRSWGGAVKSEIESVSEDSLVFVCHGLRRDIGDMVLDMGMAYVVHTNIIDEKPIDPASFGDDIFYTDTVEQTVRITVCKKESPTI
jgi:DNA polymerase I-like protein with 3'-5' exonuclease and polymerase domains